MPEEILIYQLVFLDALIQPFLIIVPYTKRLHDLNFDNTGHVHTFHEPHHHLIIPFPLLDLLKNKPSFSCLLKPQPTHFFGHLLNFQFSYLSFQVFDDITLRIKSVYNYSLVVSALVMVNWPLVFGQSAEVHEISLGFELFQTVLFKLWTEGLVLDEKFWHIKKGDFLVTFLVERGQRVF